MLDSNGQIDNSQETKKGGQGSEAKNEEFKEKIRKNYSSDLNPEVLREIEEKIGYTFRNRDLLFQAFIRSSAFEDHSFREDNEILEFIGDKVLDFVIIRFLSERYGRSERDEVADSLEKMFPDLLIPKSYHRFYLTEGELTDTKIQMVSGTRLASAMDQLGFHRYLIMGEGDKKNNVGEQSHVKEDLFEAILGAVALDSGWDPDVAYAVVSKMLNPQKILDAYSVDGRDHLAECLEALRENRRASGTPPYEIFCEDGIWCCTIKDLPATEKEPVLSVFYSQYHSENWLECPLKRIPKPGEEETAALFPPEKTFCGYGGSQEEAILRAVREFENYQEINSRIRNCLSDDKIKPTEANAINLLQELWQKGLISEPEYDFQQTEDQNEFGTGMWDCHVTIRSPFLIAYASDAPSKTAAKKWAAFVALNIIFEKNKEQETNDRKPNAQNIKQKTGEDE